MRNTTILYNKATFPLAVLCSKKFTINLPKHTSWISEILQHHIKEPPASVKWVKSDMDKICTQETQRGGHWFLVIKGKTDKMHFNLRKGILWVFLLIYSSLKSNGHLSKWTFSSTEIIKNGFVGCKEHPSELIQLTC